MEVGVRRDFEVEEPQRIPEEWWAVRAALQAALNGLVTAEPVPADGWTKNEANNTWSYIENGKPLTGWQRPGTNKCWYLFDANGIMLTGWQKVDGKWYYLSRLGDNAGYAEGAMRTGWVKVDGEWYYLNSSGAMLRSQWVKSSGAWYYLQSSGAMATSQWIGNYWVNASGVWTNTK